MSEVILFDGSGRAISRVEGPPVPMRDGESFESFSHDSGSNLISQGQSRVSSFKTTTDRQEDVARARTFFREDGPSKQIIRLYRSMSIGSGMGAVSTDEDEKIQEAVNKRIKQLFTDRTNRKSLSSKGQGRLANSLLVNGELFVALFLGSKKDVTKVRIIDVLEITDIISESEDADIPICYKRVSNPIRGKTDKRLYFDAWASDEEIKKTRAIADESDATGKNPFEGFTVQDPKEVRIVHVTIETLSQRGNSILLTCIYPAQAHRGFLTARNAIIRSRATIAWDETIKGGTAAVNSRIASLGSSITQDHPWESSPPPVAGSTMVHNDGIERKPVKQDTQAGDAKIDNEIGLQAIGVGVSIQAEFLGAQNTSRLANGLADLITMAKAIGEFQECFADLIADIVEIDQIAFGRNDDKAREFTVVKPPIVSKDKKEEVELLLAALEKAPSLEQSDSIMLALFAALEIDEPAKTLQELRSIVPSDDDSELSEINGANTVKMLSEMKKRLEGKIGKRNLTVLMSKIENQHKDGDSCCE